MDPDDLLTVEEVARELRVSRRTVYALVHRKELLPPLQIGGRSFWARLDVEATRTARRGLRPGRRKFEDRSGDS
jgi:excisionase family DNA binding protein